MLIMNSKLIKTIFLLIIALIVLPFTAFYIDQQYPLNEIQWDTIKLLFSIMIGTAIICFIIGEMTKNCSQVDKLWSIIPSIYVWIVCFASNFNPRLILISILVTIWSIRLTYNFSRRGGYSWKFWSGEEDYRWEVLRQHPIFKNKFIWKIFHLLFICCYQMSLILLFTLPIIVSWQGNATPLNYFDALVSILMIGLIIIETIADQQQWNFQKEKYIKIKNLEHLPEKFSHGFLNTGLWSIMRHPNYSAEQGIWISYYLFSIIATGRYINWSMAGVVLLLLLFQGSADFSEEISNQKYPKYKDYIKKVPRFFPKLW